MITPEELERMRGRIERIERELDGAKSELAALERRAVGGAGPAKMQQAVEVVVAKAQAMPPPLPKVVQAVPLTQGVQARVVVPELPKSAAVETRARAEGPCYGAEESEPSVLRDWLERLQLWPPATDEEGNAEARLGAWWATRIGALLAVIGVVFFGVYVSLHTPPWVKFCELLAVALGVTALGAWLERRLPAFGAVVFAGGLALGFFTAYAGHVVPAVRVFDSIWASVFWQGVAVAVIVGAALWRRAPLIATMAIGLGHVTAVFSGRGGFDGFALGAAALLGVVAVALRRVRG
ncbi:MAG: DUF2339 domain-containing protein, partial [Burkholderiales bacterium]|nr:DUF2339 domain-containing protein [Opitutaceae bacterium]